MNTHSVITDFSWHLDELVTVLPIVLTIVFFVIFWFTSKSAKIKTWFYKKYDSDQASVRHITFGRLVGFLCMCILPGIICLILLPEYSLADYGLTYKPETIQFTIFWTFVLSLLVIPLAFISGQKPKNLVNYPMIRAKVWNNKIVVLNALGWALYLFGYEFLFRGLLLFPLAEHLGVWTAIAINISLYSATHIPKGLEETLGAIPLGLVLCLLTLASGTIWIAFFVHVAMAWTNSFTALKFHPDIHYKRSSL